MNLAHAIALASEIHLDHTDKGGRPYILHPLRVMMRLRSEDDELNTIAVLHDTLEDGNVTVASLTRSGYSGRVTGALHRLTRPKDMPYDEYIRGITTNIDSMLVKIEDLRDNSDITRLKGLTQKDFERIEKYQRSFTFIRGVLASHRRAYQV